MKREGCPSQAYLLTSRWSLSLPTGGLLYMVPMYEATRRTCVHVLSLKHGWGEGGWTVIGWSEPIFCPSIFHAWPANCLFCFIFNSVVSINTKIERNSFWNPFYCEEPQGRCSTVEKNSKEPGLETTFSPDNRLALTRAKVQEKLGEEFAKDLHHDIACPVSSPWQ